MRDRDTLYRISQTNGVSCAFEEWVPGFTKAHGAKDDLITVAHRVVENALTAGKVLEKGKPSHFGQVESPFLITPGQTGKVRGDVFELLCRAVLWNVCAAGRGDDVAGYNSKFALPDTDDLRKPNANLAIITLGDNYDLTKLLEPNSANRLVAFQKGLAEQETSLEYSTPDIVGIRLDRMPEEVKSYFAGYFDALSFETQQKLNTARTALEGKVDPTDIVFAAGIKTSIRSDRMYQFLYEANSWKFLWKRVFDIEDAFYYVLTSQIFGANPKKLRSVSFASSIGEGELVKRAIDGVEHVKSSTDLIGWGANMIEKSIRAD